KIVKTKRELINRMTSSRISNPKIFGFALISFGISYVMISQPLLHVFWFFHILFIQPLLDTSTNMIHFLSCIITGIMCSCQEVAGSLYRTISAKQGMFWFWMDMAI